MSSDLEKAANHWSEHANKPELNRVRWRESDFLVRTLNERVCGQHIGGASRGMHAKLKNLLNGGPIKRAVSVGAGRGAKEMALIQAGLVENFDLYEISEVFIEQGLKLAHDRGVADNVRYFSTDAFSTVDQESVDMVHWNDALHHMLDVDAAVRWSRNVLRGEGVFYLDDYVGPNRFQWSDHCLELATRIRTSLPERYLASPYQPNTLLPRRVHRPNADKVAEIDPTEAPDSEAIIPAISKYFPAADVTLTGGTILRLALNDVIHNLDEDADRHILSMVATIDELSALLGETSFAAVLARKGSHDRAGR